MTYDEKKALVKLLNLYENEILELDSELKEKGEKWFDWSYNGNKARLSHIRILRNKLSLDIENEIYNPYREERKDKNERRV